MLRFRGILAVGGLWVGLGACARVEQISLPSVAAPTQLEEFPQQRIELTNSRLIYWKENIQPTDMAAVLQASSEIDTYEAESYRIRQNPVLQDLQTLQELSEKIRRLETVIEDLQKKIDEEMAGAARPARLKRYLRQMEVYEREKQNLKEEFDVQMTPERQQAWRQMERLAEIETWIAQRVNLIQNYSEGSIRTDTKIALDLDAVGNLVTGYVLGLESIDGKRLSFSLEPGAINTLQSMSAEGAVYHSVGGVLRFRAMRNPFLQEEGVPAEVYTFELARTRYADSLELKRSFYSGELRVTAPDGVVLHRAAAKFVNKAL